jgi:hypothetical protein
MKIEQVRGIIKSYQEKSLVSGDKSAHILLEFQGEELEKIKEIAGFSADRQYLITIEEND